MDSRNPTTEEILETYERHGEAEIEARVAAATERHESWREREVEERARLLESAASVLRDGEDEYAELMTAEMGKPVAAARSEVEKCAWVCDHYAEHAVSYLADERLASDPGTEVLSTTEPFGVILAVMPWNFPFWQVFRFASAHLTAGNVGLLKHASNVPGCALAIEDVFREAGYPADVFASLLVGSDAVEDLLADDRIAAATLTGSDGAGRAVGSTAGEHLKKTVLELGGSDPFLVLDDAPIDAAARAGARARTINSGQSCIAAKRFVVHEGVRDEFVEGLTREMDELAVGDPADRGTDLGPQARADLLDDLDRQVAETVEAGASVVLGGERLVRTGHFYPPTVLVDVPRDAPAATEEVFGPVAAVFEVPDEDVAIEVANDTRFGLGANVWTDDPDRGADICRRLNAGVTVVNDIVQSDPRHPFGGVKDSGYGRELGREGIREFVNRKTVWVERGDGHGFGERSANEGPATE